MSIFGLKFAKLYGKKLLCFASQSDAEQELYAFRDARLRQLDCLLAASDTFEPDGTPESLKQIEAWYFDLWEGDAFKSIGSSRKEVEECMAMYFGHVLVQNVAGAEWIVSEYTFEKDKYELGVRHGLVSVMFQRFKDHFKTPNNKRRQSIWRLYKEHCR